MRRRDRSRARIVLLACTALLVSSSARAEIVVEVYSGKRPRAAAPVVGALQRLFSEKFDVPWTTKQVREDLKHLPKPGVSEPGITASDLYDKIEAGKRESVRVLPNGQVNFDDGEKALTAAREAVYANAAVVVVDPNARATLMRGAIALAIARMRMKNQAGADEVLADLARSTGGAPLVNQGIEIEKNYNRVNAELAKRSKGKLLVLVNDPDALIFVDEAGVGRGGTFSGELIPGPHRVVILAQGTSLRYDVEVESGAIAKLDLDWEVETSLRIRDDYIGVELSAQPSVDRLLEIGRRLHDRSRSKSHRDGQDVILLNVEESCGRTILSGIRYSDSTRTKRKPRLGRVALGGGNDGQRLDDLASYVIDNASTARFDGKTDVSGLVFDDAQPWCSSLAVQRSAEPAAAERGSSFSLTTALFITGTATLGAGVTWHYLSSVNQQQPGGSSDPKVQSLAVAGVGAYAAGVGIAAWMGRRYRLSRPASIAVASGIGSTTLGALLIITDEDPAPSGRQLPRVRDTATSGAIVGGVGLGSLMAAWLLSRGGGESGAPMISLSPGRSYLGWVQSF